MSRSFTVLVAEERIAAALRKLGYQVIEARDGLDVLDRVRQHQPDVTVLDEGLPRLGGIEVCRRLHASGAPVRILVIAATSDSSARIEALRAGADDVLGNVFDFEELRARIEALARRGRPATRRVASDQDRDPLTRLPNQRFMTRFLDEELGRAAAASDPLSVMAIDLDGFDGVNERFGRAAGDRLLAAAARGIVRACREEDLVARAGGDEFVVVMPGVHFAASVAAAERVWKEIDQTALLDAGARIACGTSIGVASYPSRGIESSNDLLRYAHAALARAKTEGRGSICLYQHHGFLFQPT